MAEILGWATALLSLIGFGLSLGLNPALYGATADMLARKTSVPVHLGSMILGLYIGASALFLLLQAFNPTSFVSAVKQRAHDELFNRAVDLGAGLVFLVLAIVIAVWALRVPERAPKPTKDTNTDNAQGSHPWTRRPCRTLHRHGLGLAPIPEPCEPGQRAVRARTRPGLPLGRSRHSRGVRLHLLRAGVLPPPLTGPKRENPRAFASGVLLDCGA